MSGKPSSRFPSLRSTAKRARVGPVIENAPREVQLRGAGTEVSRNLLDAPGSLLPVRLDSRLPREGGVLMLGTTKTVIGYSRCSTDEQAESGAGLAAQRQAIEAECERRGWNLLEIVEDAGYSAGSLHRPGIEYALKAMRTGKAEALVVSRLDRLSRSTLDFADLIGKSQKKGWAIVVLDIGVDLTAPNGRLVGSVLAAVAAWERDLIAQRTKEAMAAKKAAGATFGRERLIPVEVAERIRAARDAGKSLRAIADSLNADEIPTVGGGRQWWDSTVRGLLAQEVPA